MSDKELIDVVTVLNEWLYEVAVDNNTHYFRYSTDSITQAIEYSNVVLWDSDNDEREIENDEYEDMTKHIKKTFNDYVTHLQGIKFIS